MASLLVMVQREVGERLAAGAGDEAYGAVSVKVAYWATAAVVGKVSASVFIPRPRVESVLVRLDRHPGGPRPTGTAGWARARRTTSGSSPWSGADSPTGARCCAALARGPGRPRGVRGRRHRPDGPGRGAGPRRRGSGWPAGGPGVAVRLVTAAGPVGERSRGATAPAKLTLSLRVTGVRADGYHLLESEMVTLDLADTLVIDGEGRRAAPARGRRRWPAGDGVAGRAGGPAASVRTGQPGGPGAGRRRVGRPGSGWSSGSRPGAGLGGGSADAAAVLRWAGCTEPGRGRRARGRRPVLRGRGSGPGQRDRRGGDAPALRGAGVHLLLLALRGGHGGRLPGLGPPGRGRGSPGAGPARGQRPRGGRPGGGAPARGLAATRLGRATGRPARLAGSGSTWFVEGAAVDGLDPGRETGVAGARTGSRAPPGGGPDGAGAPP